MKPVKVLKRKPKRKHQRNHFMPTPPVAPGTSIVGALLVTLLALLGLGAVVYSFIYSIWSHFNA